MKFFNNRWVRLLLIISIIIGISVAFLPRLFYNKNVDGVVNSHVTTLRSPIEGVVRLDNEQFRQGTPLSYGEYIGKIDNVLIDYSYLMELRTEKNFLEKRVSSLRNSTNDMISMRTELYDRISKYRDYRSDELGQRIASMRSEVSALQATLNYEVNRLNRFTSLLNSGLGSVSEQDVDEKRSIVSSLRYNIQSLNHEIESLETNLEAINNEVFLGEGNNDLPYSNQRIDEINLGIIRQQAQISETIERISQIEDQITIESEQKNREQSYTMISPVNGVVWRNYIGHGSSVAIDAELMKIINCDSLFLDITVSEGLFDNITPNQKVDFRFFDSNKMHKGTVRSIQGVGMIPVDNTVAAVVGDGDDSKRLNRVIIDIDEIEQFQSYENSCNVGRRVVVVFPKGN